MPNRVVELVNQCCCGMVARGPLVEQIVSNEREGGIARLAIHADVLALHDADVRGQVVRDITVARGASDLDNSEHAF